MRETRAVCMACPARSATTLPRICFAQQRQVADQVQDLVPHEFIREAQRRIHQAVAGQHNRIFLGGAANQSLLPHGVGFVQKTKGSGRRDLRR